MKNREKREMGSEMDSVDDDEHHQHEIGQIDRQEIFPLERQELVDAQTGECPLEPNDDKRYGDSLADEPDKRGYEIGSIPSIITAGTGWRYWRNCWRKRIRRKSWRMSAGCAGRWEKGCREGSHRNPCLSDILYSCGSFHALMLTPAPKSVTPPHRFPKSHTR